MEIIPWAREKLGFFKKKEDLAIITWRKRKVKILGSMALVLAFCAVLLCCGNDSSSDPQPENLTTFHVLSNENISLDKNAVLNITLYGYDNSIDDLDAVPVLSQAQASSLGLQLPMEIEIELDVDPVKWLCRQFEEQSPENCKAKFYFHVDIDADGDNQSCPGDLVRDFDMTPFQSYSIEEFCVTPNNINSSHIKSKRAPAFRSPVFCLIA